MEDEKQGNSDDENTTAPSFLVPEPDAVTYGTVLAACERGQQWKTVLYYAQEMQSYGLDLDGLALAPLLAPAHGLKQLGLSLL